MVFGKGMANSARLSAPQVPTTTLHHRRRRWRNRQPPTNRTSHWYAQTQYRIVKTFRIAGITWRGWAENSSPHEFILSQYPLDTLRIHVARVASATLCLADPLELRADSGPWLMGLQRLQLINDRLSDGTCGTGCKEEHEIFATDHICYSSEIRGVYFMSSVERRHHDHAALATSACTGPHGSHHWHRLELNWCVMKILGTKE
mmetsp:Transcript_56545/g.129869  ORF Transcript_56545/g.129869 Transcript_56545/m.129869 type:complete len:203 (-) Transcript_56545:892-1500(-)